MAYSTVQLQAKVSTRTRELKFSRSQLAAVQRNYNTVSKLLHERLQLLEEASQQLVAERSHVAECQSQLEVTISRAEKAEQQLQHGVHLPDQLQQLQQQQADAFRTAREEEYQQRVALQEQLARMKQELYAAANNRKELADQLQEQCSLNHTANSTITKLRQQLEEESMEGRATTSQLQALRDVLARSSAQQQDMEKQFSALKARTKAAEEAAAAEQARCKQLQQELTNAKGGQANNALRLLDLQTSQQLLDEKLTRATSILAQEQAARAEADKQVLALRADLASMLRRAEAAEAAATAAAVDASQAQHKALEAQAAQLAAEEADKTADAATKLITQRLVEAQQQAANERAIAEATQHELQQQLAEKDAALQQQRQLEQSWRFRQLEASTRALATLEHLQGKVDALDAAAACYAAAVQQQHDSQHSELEQQLSRLTAWEATAEELSGVGSRIDTALVHMAQQWVAKQQKLRSSDKGMQVLQKQVEQLEQQLSMAMVMERKLQSELADVQAAREKDQAEAAHEVQQSAAAVAAAEAAASAAQTAAAQQQAQFAQLETRVAAAESESTSLRLKLAAKAGEVASMSGNVRSASRRLQRLAAAASDMVGMLERMGALQPDDVAALLTQLGMVIGSRPTTARTPSRPGTPAAGAAVAGSTASSDVSNALQLVADSSGSKQLLDNMGCLQQQMQVLVAATQQLAEGSQYHKLLESWKEVSSVADKLLHVEESLASNYTCLVCMKVFDHPVSAVPCGHNYCRGCYVGTLGGKCRECSGTQAGSCIPAPALEQLCAKFEYRLLTLQGLQGLAQRQTHGVHAASEIAKA